jgi:hypothetical protein
MRLYPRCQLGLSAHMKMHLKEALLQVYSPGNQQIQFLMGLLNRGPQFLDTSWLGPSLLL